MTTERDEERDRTSKLNNNMKFYLILKTDGWYCAIVPKEPEYSNFLGSSIFVQVMKQYDYVKAEALKELRSVGNPELFTDLFKGDIEHEKFYLWPGKVEVDREGLIKLINDE